MTNIMFFLSFPISDIKIITVFLVKIGHFHIKCFHFLTYFMKFSFFLFFFFILSFLISLYTWMFHFFFKKYIYFFYDFHSYPPQIKLHKNSIISFTIS